MRILTRKKSQILPGKSDSNNMQYIDTPHVCRLPQQEDIIVRYIDSGNLVDFRRWFRKLMLASDRVTRCRLILKSLVRIRGEQERQLRFHYYMVHPFSLGRIYWECFQIVVLILSFIIVPLEIANADENEWKLRALKLMLDVMFCGDIIATFYTGRFNKNTKYVTLTQNKVARSYLTGTFLPDVLSIINVDVIADMLYPSRKKLYCWELKVFNFFKLARLHLLFRYLENIRDWRVLSEYKFKIFKLILITIILLIWYSCVYLMVLQIMNDDWMLTEKKVDKYIYIHVFMRVTQLIFLYGYGIEEKRTIYACYMDISTMTVGVVYRVFLMCQILQILYKYKSSGNKYSQIVSQLDEYTKYKNLSLELGRRVTDYYNFRFQKTFFREDIIMDSISQQLKQRILMHTCQKFLDTVEIFKDLPTSLLFKIVTSMRAEFYLPNDTIVNAGEIGDSMYFILTGTVAVYTKTGKEVCHLYDGNNFGEICLVLERESRVASVVAVDYCECYILKREAFHRAIEPYPDLLERIREIARQRLMSTENLTDQDQIQE